MGESLRKRASVVFRRQKPDRFCYTTTRFELRFCAYSSLLRLMFVDDQLSKKRVWRRQPQSWLSYVVHAGRPQYLADLLQYHNPTMSLRAQPSLSYFHFHTQSFPLVFVLSRELAILAAAEHSRIPVSSVINWSTKDTLLPVSLLFHITTPPTNEPWCLLDFCAIQIIYLFTYLLTYQDSAGWQVVLTLPVRGSGTSCQLPPAR